MVRVAHDLDCKGVLELARLKGLLDAANYSGWDMGSRVARMPTLGAKARRRWGTLAFVVVLWDEEEFACGLAGFEVAVGVGGVGERVDVLEAELEGAVGYAVEDVFGAGLEFGASGDVILEGRTSDVERTHGGETDEIEGWDCAAGSAEEDEQAAGAEALERLLEGGFADGVVDDGKAAA